MSSNTHVQTTAAIDGLRITPINSVKRQSSYDDDLRSRGVPNTVTADKIRKHIWRKYRHVAAVHTTTSTSCLSHDSQASPSFVGFRNLMVLTLLVGNARLMLQNIRKVRTLLQLGERLADHH